MLQFNLLPDVKLKYLKARRMKRVVTVISLLTTAGAITIFVIMYLLVNVWQKSTLEDLDKDIKASVQKISGTQDLNKILTVQGQLDSLQKLHGQKPSTSRLFGYLNKIVPAQVSLNNLTMDYSTNTIAITGSAVPIQGVNKIEAVNRFVDTLKFTTFKPNESAQAEPAFSKVVLTSFGADEKAGASFNISMEFNPIIFDSSQKTLILEVPKIITTRSEQEKPLFSEKAGN